MRFMFDILNRHRRIQFVQVIVMYLFSTMSLRESSAQSRSALMPAIRDEFQKINSDKRLSRVTLGAEEFLENAPDGGGKLTGYFRNDTLVKVVEWIGLSYGNQAREFYFKNLQLFFVFEKFESFVVADSLVGGLDHSKVKKTFEGRYYFSKDRLIRKMTSGKRLMEEDPSVLIKELVSDAREYYQLLSKHKPG